MIEEKADSECVHIGPVKVCERHKKVILDKQEEIKRTEGRRIGKAVAIKLLIEEIIELRSGSA